VKRRILRLFARFERPAAWMLMVGGAVVFVGVLADLVRLGNAKLGTLLIAADLVVSGFSAVQEAEDEESEGDQPGGGLQEGSAPDTTRRRR
jgi:hypothetical protein